MTLSSRSIQSRSLSTLSSSSAPHRVPLRVAIVAVSASEHLSGVSRHAVNMARCLLTRDEISEVHVIVADWQLAAMQPALSDDDPKLRLHSVTIGRNTLSRNLWYYKELPLVVVALAADVVHLTYPVPIDPGAFHCPTIVTLHDLYPYDIPGNFRYPKVIFNRLILQQCLRAVDAIACVSESTLGRLDIHLPQQALQKAVTIYNCVEADPLTTPECPLPYWNGEPFLLCVAQHRLNKNIPFTVEVFRQLLAKQLIDANARLVILGIEGPETPGIHKAIDDAGLARQVLLLCGVSDAELQWCYRNCALLLVPSITEGFGLPVVEAMLQHCRIVCSDIPALREVGGAYCHYVPLELAAEGFAEGVCAVLGNIKFLPARTEQFGVTEIAEAYMTLYSDLHVTTSQPVDTTLWPRRLHEKETHNGRI